MVERSETHRAIAASNTESVGFASLNPPYKARPRRRLHGKLVEDRGKPRMSEQFSADWPQLGMALWRRNSGRKNRRRLSSRPSTSLPACSALR